MTASAPASLFNTLLIDIGAPIDRVWTTFLDRRLWMPSFVSRHLRAGHDNQVGAIADVRMDVPSSPVRQEELLYCVYHRRLVVRITAEGSAMIAHADFAFDPAPDRCRLQVSIHTVLGGGSSGDLRIMAEATDAKISSDFEALKFVCERPTPLLA